MLAIIATVVNVWYPYPLHVPPLTPVPFLALAPSHPPPPPPIPVTPYPPVPVQLEAIESLPSSSTAAISRAPVTRWNSFQT